MKPRPPEPVHLIDQPGDRYSLCGIKKPMPVCAVKHAPAHRYPQARCPTCFEQAGLGDMLTDLEKRATIAFSKGGSDS